MLCNFYILVNFQNFLLFLLSSLIALWLKGMLYIMMILDHILGHLYHIMCLYVMGGLGDNLRHFCIVTKKTSVEENSHCVTIISMIFTCLTSQGKPCAWQQLISHFFVYIYFFFLRLLFFISPELKAAESLFAAQGHLLVLRCQAVLLKRATASDPFVNIQIIPALILNSLRPFVSSQMAYKSVIHLEDPNKLC